MFRTHATSGDERLLGRLSSGAYRSRVHSVFARVVNLECTTSGRLDTLACTGTDNAPATLVVDLPSFARLGLAQGAPARCTGTTLRVGAALAVSFEGAEPWSPALPEWPRADMPVQWLRELVETRGVAGGVKPAPHVHGPREGPLVRRLGELTGALKDALLQDDTARAYEHAARLVGLGPGLTPAGDDHLLGLAAICNLPGSPVAHLRPLLSRLVGDAAGRTNAISHAAMSHAAEGRVRESIAELLAAMASGDRAAMDRRGARVVSIGASSGTDILTGMLAGLELAQAGQG